MFIDGTHIKANVNTKKAVKAQISAASKHLMEEVNADRESHTACDKYEFVPKAVVTPGNVHDSVAFDEVYDKVFGRFPEIETSSSRQRLQNTSYLQKGIINARRRLRGSLQMQKKNTLCVRVLAQVAKWGKLKFAAMNLKRLAKWKWKNSHFRLFDLVFSTTRMSSTRQKTYLCKSRNPKLSMTEQVQ